MGGVSDVTGGIGTMPPVAGREAPPEGVHVKRKVDKLDVVPMPFETDPLRIHRPVTSLRGRTSAGVRLRRNEPGYAVRFKDYSWGHTGGDEHDHYATRSELQEIDAKYEEIVDGITATTLNERLRAMQAAADMLIGAVSAQLRVERLDQAKLVEKARLAYAEIFRRLIGASDMLGAENERVREENMRLHEQATRMAAEASERIHEAEVECERRVQETEGRLDAKQKEYDAEVRRFMEEKRVLEEHVKALHRVFLDFQNDSVYITLEDLKQRQEQAERRVSSKNAEIARLTNCLTHLQSTIAEQTRVREGLEANVEHLNGRLRAAAAQISRLQRQLEVAADEPSAGGAGGSDEASLVRVFHRAALLESRLGDYIAEATGTPASEGGEEEAEEGGRSFPAMILEKVNSSLRMVEQLSQFSLGPRAAAPLSVEPRFARFVSKYLGEEDEEGASTEDLLALVRRLFVAKYYCDLSRAQARRPLQRFPEFVLSFFARDGSIFAALKRGARLWKHAKGSEVPEIAMFREFLTEQLTVDELAMFLEIRFCLLGSECGGEQISVQWSRCRELLDQFVGQFSPHLPTIVRACEAATEDGRIDYAVFVGEVVRFYAGERKKRRNAVRLMVGSRTEELDLEAFVGLVQSLGYQGELDWLFELYREASLASRGPIDLAGLLAAMDDMAFHFFTLDLPGRPSPVREFVGLTKDVIEGHWRKFSAWFAGFRERAGVETWTRAEIARRVDRVSALFASDGPSQVLYTEYRGLLDDFQRHLAAAAAGCKGVLAAEKCERQLLLLENLIDLLLAFVGRGGGITYAEYAH